MIISPGRGYVFVHIPKTGGTSMAAALEARAMKDDLLIGDTPKARRRKARLQGLTPAGRLWKHSTLADIEGVVDRAAFERMFVFTLVRNPWDRMVSYYHWLLTVGFDHPAVQLAKSLSFSDFLAHPHTGASLAGNPYASYLTDGAGRAHGHFLRIEQLDADAGPLWDHLGFRLALERHNPSQRHRDWRGYYTAESAARLAALCADDIARFGYGFDDCA